jgi:hypothetical protein
MYENEMHLKFHTYRDTEWPKFLREQLCSTKIRASQQSYPITFTRRADGTYESKLQVLVTNKPVDGSKEENRPHYWYFVVDDCSLEQYFRDDRVPDIQYDLKIKNYLPKASENARQYQTHLSADEQHLELGHVVTFLLSGIVCGLLGIRILLRLSDRKTDNTVHAAVLWVCAAAALDSGSSACELLHLLSYDHNGVGSYLLDCMAAHMEAVCDAAIMLLLLSIAAGWTLPHSVVAVGHSVRSPVQSLLQGLSHPIQNLLRPDTPAAILCWTVLLLHVVLAQWGRTYNDDFESYHDFEHLPGKILMWTRCLTGFLFLAATHQTSMAAATHTTKLRGFYAIMAVTGFVWFQSLPVVTWMCNSFFPYYLRRQAVFLASAFLQSASLLALSWLVTAHSGGSAYHKISRMASGRQDSLSESISSFTQDSGEATGGGKASSSTPRTWSLTGGKAKVRLD